MSFLRDRKANRRNVWHNKRHKKWQRPRFGRGLRRAPGAPTNRLYYGARKSAHAAANLARIEQFAAAVQVLSCDAATAQRIG